MTCGTYASYNYHQCRCVACKRFMADYRLTHIPKGYRSRAAYVRRCAYLIKTGRFEVTTREPVETRPEPIVGQIPAPVSGFRLSVTRDDAFRRRG